LFKLVAIDIDGTLLADDGSISERNKAAVNQATLRTQVVLCTGRGYLSGRSILDLFSSPLSFISNNGAVILHHQHGIIHQAALPDDVLEAVVHFCRRENLRFGCNTLDNIYVERRFKGIAEDYRKFYVVPTAVDDILAEDLKIVKISIASNPDKARTAYRHLLKSIGQRASVTQGGPGYVDITAESVNKATALRKLAAIAHIRPSEIIAMGNYYNDMEMIKMAGLGVAVGNAPEDVKKTADWVTLTNNEDGVAHALERFVLKNEGFVSGSG